MWRLIRDNGCFVDTVLLSAVLTTGRRLNRLTSVLFSWGIMDPPIIPELLVARITISQFEHVNPWNHHSIILFLVIFIFVLHKLSSYTIDAIYHGTSSIKTVIFTNTYQTMMKFSKLLYIGFKNPTVTVVQLDSFNLILTLWYMKMTKKSYFVLNQLKFNQSY